MNTIEMEELEGFDTFLSFLKFLATSRDEHKHRCLSCGFIWDHVADEIEDSESAKRAHTCAKCGLEQWEKYFGSDKSTCLNNGARIQYR